MNEWLGKRLILAALPAFKRSREDQREEMDVTIVFERTHSAHGRFYYSDVSFP